MFFIIEVNSSKCWCRMVCNNHLKTRVSFTTHSYFMSSIRFCSGKWKICVCGLSFVNILLYENYMFCPFSVKQTWFSCALTRLKFAFLWSEILKLIGSSVLRIPKFMFLQLLNGIFWFLRFWGKIKVKKTSFTNAYFLVLMSGFSTYYFVFKQYWMTLVFMFKILEPKFRFSLYQT